MTISPSANAQIVSQDHYRFCSFPICIAQVFQDPAIRKKSPLGGVAVKFAGFRNIFLLLPRHFRCIWGTGYAARAEVFPGDVVLSWPVFFACRWLHLITADAVHVVPCGCRNGATCSPQSRGNDPSCSHATRDPPARPASGLFSDPAAGRLSQALRRFVGRHILRSIFVCLRFLSLFEPSTYRSFRLKARTLVLASRLFSGCAFTESELSDMSDTTEGSGLA